MTHLAGLRVLVMGLGRFGGGVGVTRFLASRGAKVLVTDLSPADQLHKGLAELADLQVDYRLGEHRTEDFTSADLIVVNPAVDPRKNPYLLAAAEKGVPTTSEIRLLIENLPARDRVVGITGSSGKSTTTAMLGHVLRKLWGEARVHVGGNLGGSLLPDLPRIAPNHLVVLELSSFMLEGLAPARWSPHIALVTNLLPNHLDRHGTMRDYALAKQQILEHQQAADHAILGPVPTQWIQPRTTRVKWLENLSNYSHTAIPPLLVPGEHNRRNAAMAIEAAACLGFSRLDACEAIKTFAGLPHRLQLVAERAGIRYYNDSKATTPEAAMLALSSFPKGVLHVILGGSDKGSDFTAMASLAKAHSRAVYTIGVTGDRIAALADAAAGEAAVLRAGNLRAALEAAAVRLREHDVVLLSPGCASYDQFENYEDRGNQFASLVLDTTGEGSPLPRA